METKFTFMKLSLLAVFSTFLVGISSVQGAQGLNYKYYEGSWSLLPDFNALTPVKTGTSTAVNLDPRNRDQQYAFLYEGYITIPTTGTYTFETYSDDGSKLYIGTYNYNTVSLVNNDGMHGSQYRTGSITLTAGIYPIALTYFQGTQSQTWQIYWSSNTGVARQLLPSSVLSTTNGTTTTTTTATTGTQGLNYSYYEGIFSVLPDFSLLSPIKSGTTTNFSIDPRNREKWYGFVYSGYITIPTTGTYTFSTNSDDGSKLYIGNYSFLTTPLVTNDGLHGSQIHSGSIALNAGVYPITMTYFQYDGSQTMEVYWSSNTGISLQKVPDNVLSTGTSTTTSTSGTGLSYNYYEGTWTTLPDFSLLTPVKSGTTTNIDLSPRNRDANYAFVWQGYINIPTTGTYTFETYSDDGSQVYVGSSTTALVNNDGLHTSQLASGAINLNAGLNSITITYFQGTGSQAMELYWSSNVGLSRDKVPNSVLSPATIIPPVLTTTTTTTTTTVTTGSSGSGGLTGVNNYYFSSTIGDDSRSSTQAKNPLTPWKTLSKLSSVMSGLKAGDAVLFNRGDSFDGSINFSVSGGSGTPIIMSSYGTGNKPVINGLYTLGGWVNIGNGIWQASCPSSDRVNMVTLNGVAQAMGRYPNITEPNKGFLTIDAHAGTYLITDYQLSGSPNFTGAEVVIRKMGWVLDRCLITNHSGNNIYYNTPTSHEPTDGNGYFIQNSDQTLDQLGEWYFDPNNKILKMYFGSNNPNTYDVKASTVNSLLTISSQSNFLIDNIAFVGGDDYGIKVEYASNVRVQNSSVDLSGTEAVSALNVASFSFEANSITNTNNDALDANSVSNSSIKGNSIKNTGLIKGMGQSGNQQYNGILVQGSGNTIELNTVENTGYCGIIFAGELCTVRNNYVNNFCMNLEDGGGIYGWGDLTKYNRSITGNVVLNGIGSPEGLLSALSTGAAGIFHDDESANVDMTGNTIANCNRAGIFIHNSHEMTLRNNTIFNNKIQLSMVHDAISINNPIRNITMDNNVVFSKSASQFVLEMRTMSNDLANFGTFTNNYYDRPLDENGSIYTTYYDGSTYQYNFYDLGGWKLASGSYDQQSKSSPVKVAAFKVNSYNSGNTYGNSSFTSNTGNVFCLTSPGKCAISLGSGKLDGNALQVSFQSAGVLTNVGSYIDIGATAAGHQYLIKFSLIGSQNGKTLKAFMLDGSTYAHLSDTKYFALNTYRTENTFLYTAPSSGSSTLAFEIPGPDGPYWMDNFQVYDVNTTATIPDDYIRFEYNATSSAKTVALNGNYVDAKGNVLSGNINLDPFTSIVLINQTASQLVSDPATQNVTATPSALTLQGDVTSSDLSVKVSPNPASNYLNISINAPQNAQKSTLTVNNILGVTVKTIPLTTSSTTLNLDISTWSNGVYIINYNSDGHIITKKFVKQ